jgi:hypothetical protein
MLAVTRLMMNTWCGIWHTTPMYISRVRLFSLFCNISLFRVLSILHQVEYELRSLSIFREDSRFEETTARLAHGSSINVVTSEADTFRIL